MRTSHGLLAVDHKHVTARQSEHEQKDPVSEPASARRITCINLHHGLHYALMQRKSEIGFSLSFFLFFLILIFFFGPRDDGSPLLFRKDRKDQRTIPEAATKAHLFFSRIIACGYTLTMKSCSYARTVIAHPDRCLIGDGQVSVSEQGKKKRDKGHGLRNPGSRICTRASCVVLVQATRGYQRQV